MKTTDNIRSRQTTKFSPSLVAPGFLFSARAATNGTATNGTAADGTARDSSATDGSATDDAATDGVGDAVVDCVVKASVDRESEWSPLAVRRSSSSS